MFGLLVALTIFAFVGGSYFSQGVTSQKESISEVKSAKTEIKDSSDVSSKAEVKVDVNSETKSSVEKTSPAEINEFKYPGSSVLSSDSNKLSLKSSDSTDKITDWYKTIIKSKDLSATSFVTTSTNGKVLNKLAADGVFHIEVKIQKEGDSQAEIEVVTTK